MWQMKQQFIPKFSATFFIWLLIWCYRMPPSTNVPMKYCTKGFIFSFFREAFFHSFNFYKCLIMKGIIFRKTSNVNNFICTSQLHCISL